MSIAEKYSGSELLFDKKHQLFFNFLEHTDQAKNAVQYMNTIIMKILQNILDTTPLRYLDIGCGYGYKTQSIIDSVKQNHCIHTTALDPSAELLSIFKDQSTNKNIELVCSTWEDYQSENTFHLITSIHTFYYITDWKSAINKMLRLLDEKGAICIAIRSNDQVCQFKNHFFKKLDGINKKEHDFDELCQTLNSLGLQYESKIIESRLDINDCLEMNEKGKQLIEFLLRLPYSDLPNNLHTEIKNYLKKYQSDGYLLQQDGFVWITY